MLKRVGRVRPSVEVTADKPAISRVRRPVPIASDTSPQRITRVRPAPSSASISLPRFEIPADASLYRLFSIYMVLSYIYYVMNRSVVPDAEYDLLCVKLCREYNGFSHPHKRLVDRGQLRAGTGYAIRKYPLIVQGAAMDMLRRYAEV